MKKNRISTQKAKLILKEGETHGHKLTDKQRRFFGARASGYPIKTKEKGGNIDASDPLFLKLKEVGLNPYDNKHGRIEVEIESLYGTQILNFHYVEVTSKGEFVENIYTADSVFNPYDGVVDIEYNAFIGGLEDAIKYALKEKEESQKLLDSIPKSTATPVIREPGPIVVGKIELSDYDKRKRYITGGITKREKVVLNKAKGIWEDKEKEALEKLKNPNISKEDKEFYTNLLSESKQHLLSFENGSFEMGGELKNKFISIVPQGTVFVKVNSHRASQKVESNNIPKLELYNFYGSSTAGQSVILINKSDYDKIKNIKGVSEPFDKLRSEGMIWKPKLGWNSKDLSPEQEKLYESYKEINEKSENVLEKGGQSSSEQVEYKIINIRSENGMREAENMKRQGWMIESSGSDSIKFYKKKKSPLSTGKRMETGGETTKARERQEHDGYTNYQLASYFGMMNKENVKKEDLDSIASQHGWEYIPKWDRWFHKSFVQLDDSKETGGEILTKEKLEEIISYLNESIESKTTSESLKEVMRNKVSELSKKLSDLEKKTEEEAKKNQRNVTIPENKFWVDIDDKYKDIMRKALGYDKIEYESKTIKGKLRIFVESQELLDRIVAKYNMKRAKGKDKPISVSDVSGKSEKGGKLWSKNAKKKEIVLRNKARRMGMIPNEQETLSETDLDKLEKQVPSLKQKVSEVRRMRNFKH